jgi:aminoglycoside phosphotransferase family enzyme
MTSGRSHCQGNSIDQERKIALLKEPQTYPENPLRIEVVETHMSWVFLTRRHAYKLKKPVRYDFLDFSTLAAREKNCAEEVRLNRRLARDLYLGVIPLIADPLGKVRLGGEGEILDWLVKMRRLPRRLFLDHMIKQHTIRETDIRRVAFKLAQFYKQCPPLTISGSEYRTQLRSDIYANFRELGQALDGLPSDDIALSQQAQLALLNDKPELFDQRASAGRIIEGHGDLRPEHICLEDEPVIFDCLEFNRRFRTVDAADELAFLAMECERIGAAFTDSVLFEVYTQITNDQPEPELVNFYKAYRACLRAKLAIWHTRELAKPAWPKWCELASHYLGLARKYSQRIS